MTKAMRAFGCGASWELLAGAVGLVVMIFSQSLSVGISFLSAAQLPALSAASEAQC
jgi:hypothetical protein